MSILDIIEQGVFSECEIALQIFDKEPQVYFCTESLRLLQGRRLTALATYDSREYVIKTFLPNRHAQKEFRSEIEGYELLHNASYDIPSRIYYGPANNGLSIIIYEYLTHARTLADIFLHQPPISGTAKKYLLQLIDLFVCFRRDGLIHRDPHLGNFLLREDKIYIVDMGAVHRAHNKHLINRSMMLGHNYRIVAAVGINNEHLIDKNVALMFARFPRALHIESLYLENYLRELNEDNNDSHAATLIKLIERRRQQLESKFLRKIYCECTAFHVRSTAYGHLIMDRDYLCDRLINMISDPEHVFDNENTVILKQGSTTTVGIINVDNRQYVVKRYNAKNFVHRLKLILKLIWRESRASRSWRNAHRLQFRGIRMAKPVAFMECLKGRLKGISLYVTEYVPGSNADEFFRQEHLNEEIKNDVAMKIIGFIDELAMGRLVHGNLKLTGFVIDGNEPALINLDTMKVINNRRRLLRGIEKDRQRFRESWQGNAEARLMLQPLMDAAKVWYGTNRDF